MFVLYDSKANFILLVVEDYNFVSIQSRLEVESPVFVDHG